MLTDLVLSSKVENLVVDVQDRASLIIKQVFPVPSEHGHVELTIGGKDLQPILLFLSDSGSELGPVVGIIGKWTKWVTWAAEKVNSRPKTFVNRSGAHLFKVRAVVAAEVGRSRTN